MKNQQRFAGACLQNLQFRIANAKLLFGETLFCHLMNSPRSNLFELQRHRPDLTVFASLLKQFSMTPRPL
jgi:hypothetical protein